MKQKIEYQEALENRNYKSTLFPELFKEKKELLQLFNAVNKTDYQEEDDVSFLVDSTMNLYEHQSTYNPNMPLRGVMYFGQLLHKYIKSRGLNIYSSKLQKIPVPHYVVFYNGTREEPDEKILLLSEAFQKEREDAYVHGCLECEVRMLNINYGHNKELMEKCKRLEEYAIFVAKVRRYAKEYPDRLDKAIAKAIDDCIEEEVLKDFLIERKSEVLEMVLFSFDKELYEADLKKIAYEEGREEGRTLGELEKLKTQVTKKLKKGLCVPEIAEMLEEEEAEIQKIVDNEIEQK